MSEKERLEAMRTGNLAEYYRRQMEIDNEMNNGRRRLAKINLLAEKKQLEKRLKIINYQLEKLNV